MTNRSIIPMPKLEPVQYPTEEVNVFRRIWRWITYTRKWRIVEDWFFDLPCGVKIKIPFDFVMDGASVPRPLRSLLSPVGPLFLPAILHDFSYKYDKLIGVNENGSCYDYIPGAGKIFWDNLFKEVADYVNGLAHINRISYFMLSMFGFIAWNQHRRRIPKPGLIS
jgi:hypothetical protein